MTVNSKSSLMLHPEDNVCIALRDIQMGEECEPGIVTRANINRGHKIAIAHIKSGERVLRYGQVIGEATQDISPGHHVHSHNLGMTVHAGEMDKTEPSNRLDFSSDNRTFEGYRRDDGRVGTRNYVGIVTTVNCSGSVARFIAQAAEQNGLLDRFENVDGLVPIAHGTGCGMASTGDGYDTLFRTISGYTQHPNFGGVLLIGLGCEVMQLGALVGDNKIRSDGNYRYMTIQHEGGTKSTIEKGLRELEGILEIANRVSRSPQPVSKLTVGMQCGGSDGYSGITANPALGVASDILVAHGGTTILSETPEIYGAEHLLLKRAVSDDVRAKLTRRIAWWEDYCRRNGGEMDNNPSPGNKRGGLTTILEKSLGAVAKSGSAPLTEVYKYAEPITETGFVFMDSPGFDPCSITGQVASGANLIVFTTGRGSVSGFKPSPCLKLATNSEMFMRLEADMDLNCGDIISGDVSIEQKGEELFELMIDAASGQSTKSESLGFGDAEFVPWQIGAVM